jgi:hypothetical protein
LVELWSSKRDYEDFLGAAPVDEKGGYEIELTADQFKNFFTNDACRNSLKLHERCHCEAVNRAASDRPSQYAVLLQVLEEGIDAYSKRGIVPAARCNFGVLLRLINFARAGAPTLYGRQRSDAVDPALALVQ